MLLVRWRSRALVLFQAMIQHKKYSQRGYYPNHKAPNSHQCVAYDVFSAGEQDGDGDGDNFANTTMVMMTMMVTKFMDVKHAECTGTRPEKEGNLKA